MPLDAQIEALLFWKGEPVRVSWLAKNLKKTEEEIKAGLASLSQSLTERGITLVSKEDEVVLGTTPTMSAVIEELTREELSKDLGKAGLETLSIVLYRGPISRKDIDYIRGVNSAFILRNLLIRGLVEKVVSPNDQRVLLYKPTLELLTFMGLSKIEDLPEFENLKKEVVAFEEVSKQKEAEEKMDDPTTGSESIAASN